MTDQARDVEQFGLMARIGGHYCFTGKPGEKWLSYHLQRFPPQTAFGRSLLKALAVCEEKKSGLGMKLAGDLAVIPFTRKPDTYQQVIQKLAEILTIRVLLEADWPEGTIFEHEPKAPNGRLPELSVETPDRLLLFEVKCPSLIEHQFARERGMTQLPTRALPRDLGAHVTGDPDAEVTLSKDNTIRDYLKSAQDKFESFQRDKPIFGALVLVWDPHIYEVVSPLLHQLCGLLTPNSWHKDDQGCRIPFTAVDGVLVLNHWGVLVAGTRNEPLGHRTDPFGLSDDVELKNAWCQNLGGDPLPDALLRAFDARPIAELSHFAEYQAIDMVSWLEIP